MLSADSGHEQGCHGKGNDCYMSCETFSPSPTKTGGVQALPLGCMSAMMSMAIPFAKLESSNWQQTGTSPPNPKSASSMGIVGLYCQTT